MKTTEKSTTTQSGEKNEYLRVLLFRTVGNFLILSSLYMIGKTVYFPVKQEVKYLVESTVKKEYVVAESSEEKEDIEATYRLQNTNHQQGISSLLRVRQVEALVPEDPNYSILIPKIGANARIIPHVDPSNEQTYLEALKRGVAHADGTAYPGESGHIFLFAHSTDYFWNIGSYNAVFYLLDKLEPGDRILLFYQGVKYQYFVTAKTIVDPTEIEYMKRKTNREFLTLQTCWPLGTTLKRLLVFAERVSE